jgi:DNA-binding MarR family transcriptional regulator
MSRAAPLIVCIIGAPFFYFQKVPASQTDVRYDIIAVQTFGGGLMNKMEAILEYLKNCNEQYSPTVREIASVIGMSVEPTHHMLTVLRDRGYITWEPNMTRTIRLVRPA